MSALKRIVSLLNGMLPFAFALGLALVMGDVVLAQAPDRIPSIWDVPVETYLIEGVIEMGDVVGGCVAGFFVFLLIRFALHWAVEYFAGCDD